MQRAASSAAVLQPHGGRRTLLQGGTSRVMQQGRLWSMLRFMQPTEVAAPTTNTAGPGQVLSGSQGMCAWFSAVLDMIYEWAYI